jgi:hypothetical protein
MRGSPESKNEPAYRHFSDAFGIHKGKWMQEVPASYLHWLWSSGKKEDKTCPVANYIRENIYALKKEYPDGIWT